MASKKHTVVIDGKELDYNSLEDNLSLQSALLPKHFEGDKSERQNAVRLFLNYRNMLLANCDRHLVHNWPKFLRAAQGLVEDREAPIVKGGFSFELNFTASAVAAIGKTKMSASISFGSESKAQAHDVNQTELYLADDSIDPGSEESISAQREREDKELAEADEAKRIRDEEKAQKARDKAEKKGENVETFPGTTPAADTAEKPKKAAKKKIANKTKKKD